MKENDFIAQRLYNIITSYDFFTPNMSLLINGGCGLGKSFALLSDDIYNLLVKKFNKPNLQILFNKSRSPDRDQTIAENTNPNITIVQSNRFLEQLENNYDLIILDEAHSLFYDMAFAPDVNRPIIDWIRSNTSTPMIFITATDSQFLEVAGQILPEHDFCSVFDDGEPHQKYLSEWMYLSIESLGAKRIIDRRENFFFKENQRGLFFVRSATDAKELADYYNTKGYSCAFYVSAQCGSKIKSRDTNTESFWRADVVETSVLVLDTFKEREKQRESEGKESIRDAILHRRFPEDIDYIFMTDTGQEGFSINAAAHLDFVFIEDFRPAVIIQKASRYRADVSNIYVHYPVRKARQWLEQGAADLQQLMTESEDFLRGFKTAGGRYGDRLAMFIQKENGHYVVSKTAVDVLNAIKQQINISLIAAEQGDLAYFQREIGFLSQNNLRLDSSKESGYEERLAEVLLEWEGKALDVERQKEFVEQCKAAGMRNEKREGNFTFRKCKDLLVGKVEWEFVKHASKNDCIIFPYLMHRNTYYKFRII